eukprot:1194661-Prorocentrum_minimum.AAC.3
MAACLPVHVVHPTPPAADAGCQGNQTDNQPDTTVGMDCAAGEVSYATAADARCQGNRTDNSTLYTTVGKPHFSN